MYIITIDAGTTNTRIYLVEDSAYSIIDLVKKNVGVKNTAIHGSADELKRELSSGIEEILRRNDCEPKDIAYIAAAGMITSNLGLVQVPHVTGPCQKADFSTGSMVKHLPEFLNIPCIFIPGMKNSFSPEPQLSFGEELDKLDVMRGEEVETFGLIRQLELSGKGIMILPGSHTKYVMTDDGEILSCLSTLSGEMLYAIQKDTILSDSITKELVETTDTDALLQGFHSSQRNGLARTLYQLRLLQLFEKMDHNQRANFFVGAVLASDILSFQSLYDELKPDWIVVGGNNPLRGSFAYILNYLQYSNVIEATDEQVAMCTIIGAVEIGNLKMDQMANQAT